MSGKKRTAGALAALEAMRKVAAEWAEGAAQNEVDMDRHDRKSAEEQTFTLTDILAMVNDAAREVGAVKPEPPRSARRTFTVQVSSSIGVQESFSILEGDSLTVTLSGTITTENGAEWAALNVPATIVIR